VNYSTVCYLHTFIEGYWGLGSNYFAVVLENLNILAETWCPEWKGRDQCSGVCVDKLSIGGL